MFAATATTPKQSAIDLIANQESDFGIFYPTGHLVVGFPTQAQAKAIHADFMAEGYTDADCAFYGAEEVRRAAENNLAQNDGFFARLGWSARAVETHLELAGKNGAFLVIHAKTDPEVERAMTIIRQVPFAFVHRYHALVIEELS